MAVCSARVIGSAVVVQARGVVPVDVWIQDMHWHSQRQKHDSSTKWRSKIKLIRYRKNGRFNMPCSLAKPLFLIAALSLLASASLVRAQISIRTPNDGMPELSVSLGYSNLSLHSSSADDEGALHFAPGLSISPIPTLLPQLRLGADLGASLVFDSSLNTIVINNGQTTITGSSSIPLWFLEPEVRLSWRQTFGKEGEGVFVEPGIAGGGAFGFLDIEGNDGSGSSYSASSSTAYGRAFLRAGGVCGTGIFGLEGSYLQGGNMDFGGGIAGRFREYYIGVFASFRF
jgi:hypothetical protein